MALLVSAAVVIGLPVASSAAERVNAAPSSIDYIMKTEKEAFFVPSSVYATYVGSCLNAGAMTPIVNDGKHNTVYVCDVPPKLVFEMENLKFIPTTVGYRSIRK